MCEDQVFLELKGGPLDGAIFNTSDWPEDATLPGTEILDKATGSLYRYHLPSSKTHPVYTFRPQ